jgi:hypothetical protein
MQLAPLARIVVRYGAGLIFGASAADAILVDADIMNYVTMGLGVIMTAVTEAAYSQAKKRGWAT